MSTTGTTESLATKGYSVIPSVLSHRELEAQTAEINKAAGNDAGNRRLLDLPWCNEIAERLHAHPHLRTILPGDFRAVQCTLFAKSIENNWLVSLHQDLSIPVAERVESLLCTGWSQKSENIFVQPPVSVLESLVAVRLHIDDCDERNGALRVVPASHLLGRLKPELAQEVRRDLGERSVPVPRGGLMAMKPLLLHASSKAMGDGPRRVLHFLFGPPDLPEGLRWPLRRQFAETL